MCIMTCVIWCLQDPSLQKLLRRINVNLQNLFMYFIICIKTDFASTRLFFFFYLS